MHLTKKIQNQEKFDPHKPQVFLIDTRKRENRIDESNQRTSNKDNIGRNIIWSYI